MLKHIHANKLKVSVMKILSTFMITFTLKYRHLKYWGDTCQEYYGEYCREGDFKWFYVKHRIRFHVSMVSVLEI